MKTLLITVSATLLALGLVIYWALSPTRGDASRPIDATIRGVAYIGMSVTDIEATTEFYRQGVDLEPIADDAVINPTLFGLLSGEDAAKLTTRLLRSSNAQLQLMQFSPPSRAAVASRQLAVYGPGIAHVCYQVDQATNAYQKFLAAGAQTIGAREMVQLSARNPVRYAYARDPDNIMFEVEHVDISALELDTPPENQYRIRHVSLATTNMERAIGFYKVLLDATKTRRAGHKLFSLKGEKLDQVAGLENAEIEMAWFQIRNLELELIEYHSHRSDTQNELRPVDALGYNMIVFDVNDTASARAKLISAGGKVVTEVEKSERGEVFFGRDLDGNLLGFQKVADESILSSQNFKNNGL